MGTIAGALLAAGCIGEPSNPAATQPVTFQDLSTTRPTYWFDQPGVDPVIGRDVDAVFAACREVSQSYLFHIDREDYRRGMMTTKPLVSAQWFEPWRRELSTSYDVSESSIATIRRTIRWDIDRLDPQTFAATPKVLVERVEQAEARITSVTHYRYAFGHSTGQSSAPRGSREADEGIALQSRYWYPVRRDAEFEKRLADDLRNRLAKTGQLAGNVH